MSPDPAVLLCALHPIADVRHRILAACPQQLPRVEAAAPADLAALPPAAAVVVLFDPARTAPAEVEAACPDGAALVGVSDLRLPAAEAGVAALLPLRRLTERHVVRALFELAQRSTATVAR